MVGMGIGIAGPWNCMVGAANWIDDGTVMGPVMVRAGAIGRVVGIDGAAIIGAIMVGADMDGADGAEYDEYEDDELGWLGWLG
jgi:hypothetical protein